MPDRRTFVRRLLSGTIAAVCFPLLYAIGRYLRPPRALPATILVAETDLPSGSGTPRVVRLGAKDAVVVRAADGRVRAMSLVCTHTGCSVSWRPERRVFQCPCHDGVFALDGSVVDGPPRRPLERLRVETVAGGVRIADEAA